MDIFLQLVASGFLVGGIYALIALGFVLIYKATNIINFATGEFMMIGAYIFYSLMVYLNYPPLSDFPWSLFVPLCWALWLSVLFCGICWDSPISALSW